MRTSRVRERVGRAVFYGVRSLAAWLVLAAFVASLSAVGVVLTERSLQASSSSLRTELRPAQLAVRQLTLAYVDQETGMRGYALTSEPAYLDPYRRGALEVERLQDDAELLLRRHDGAVAALAEVEDAGAVWQRHAREQLMAVNDGVDPVATARVEEQGRVLFDRLRAMLTTLSDEVDRLVATDLQRYSTAQTRARAATAVAVSLSVLALVLTGLVVHYLLRRPWSRLISQLGQVARGDYERPLLEQGPQETREVARAAESMRRSILDSSRELVSAHRELSIRTERERVAADLHDHTVQRLYALGLGLDALARRRADLAPDLAPFVAQADATITELRGVIFALAESDDDRVLSERLERLVDEGARPLGFAPVLQTVGDLARVPEGVAAELVAVAREALSNVARHARASTVLVGVEVRPAADRGSEVALVVSDDGAGLQGTDRAGSGLANMRARAVRLGGCFDLRTPPGGGTEVRWTVPLPAVPADAAETLEVGLTP